MRPVFSIRSGVRAAIGNRGQRGFIRGANSRSTGRAFSHSVAFAFSLDAVELPGDGQNLAVRSCSENFRDRSMGGAGAALWPLCVPLYRL